MGKVVLLPESGRFDECAGEFVRYWGKTTSEKLPVVHSAAGHKELIIFGTDTENPLVHQLMLDGALPRLAVRHGSDDYRIRSFETKDCRGLLILGGNIRAYFYAVYDYFERCGACRYFQFCHGGCPALSILYGESLLSPDIYKCTFFENGFVRKYEKALSGWKNLVPLTEEEQWEITER
jgi:radical SAM protein with 4Fe4S-binding SPASM domain